MKKVLVTGGAGFIGSALSLKLIELGYDVLVVDSLSTQVHGTNSENSFLYKKISSKVRITQGCVTDRSLMYDALSNVDFVIHLAAETGTGQSMYEISKYTNINIGGTSIILDFIANEDHRIQKVVLASSRAIYGEGKYLCSSHGVVYPFYRNKKDLEKRDFTVKCPVCTSSVEALPTDEDSRLLPSSIYAITKEAQEKMIMSIGKALSVPTVALRFQNVYGPGQSLSNPYTGILSIFSTNILNGNVISVFEDGLESRDFVYIDDVVNSIVSSLDSTAANYESINIGSGTATTVKDIAYKLVEYFNANVEIKTTGQARLGDIRHNYADIAKASKLLSFTPQTSFDDGLKGFVEWVQGQEVKEDLHAESLNNLFERGLLVDA